MAVSSSPQPPVTDAMLRRLDQPGPSARPSVPTPSARLVIRPATLADLPALQHICRVCDLARGMDLSDFVPVPLVAVRQMADRAEVIGLIQAIAGRPTGIIGLLGVLPEHRGSRAAFELVKAAELALRLVGCPTWIALIDGTQTDWMATIEKYGATLTNNHISVFRKDLT